MKKIFFLVFLLFCALTIKGQQQLSYVYDAAGNRTARTITVGAHNTVGDTPRTYIEYIDGRQLAIKAGGEEQQLAIAVEEYDSSLMGEYSILDRNGAQLANEQMDSGTTLVELEGLSTGSYFLDILLNGHASRWELVKL